MEDDRIIGLIRNGRAESFEDLIRRYQKQAHFLALRYSNNWDEANDITQIAFIRLYEFIMRSKEKIRALPWIRRVIVNICLDRKKSKKWQSFFKNAITLGKSNPGYDNAQEPLDVIEDKRSSPEEAFLNDELRKHIDGLIDNLPNQQKNIFIMKHFEGLKIKDIAQQLNISEGQVKSQLFRAIHTMRKGLGEFYE
ncbi:MAG: RNA polymerase sigma factor [bacterium]